MEKNSEANYKRFTDNKTPKTTPDDKMEPNSQNSLKKKSLITPLLEDDNKDVDTHDDDGKGKPKTDAARKDADSPTRNKPKDADEDGDKIHAGEELKVTEQQPQSIRKALPNQEESKETRGTEEIKKTT